MERSDGVGPVLHPDLARLARTGVSLHIDLERGMSVLQP